MGNHRGTRRFHFLAAILTAIAGLAATPAASAPEPAHPDTPALTIGLIATGSVDETLKQWKPLVASLEKALQQPVRAVASKDYGDIAAGMKQGRIQLGWVSNRVAIDIVESEQANVFAQMVRDDGTLGYRSLLMVPKDSKIQSVAQLLAAPGAYRLAATKPSSMSGYLVPSYYVFGRNKLVMDQHFATIRRGSHKENFQAVADGLVDVATNNTEELPRYQAEQAQRLAKVRVIWESPLIPNDPLLMRKDLPEQTQQRIRSFFTSYGQSTAEKATLKAINGLSGFKASTNRQLKPVIDLDLFESLTAAMRDQSKAPAAFAELMSQLTKRASRLELLMNTSRLSGP